MRSDQGCRGQGWTAGPTLSGSVTVGSCSAEPCVGQEWDRRGLSPLPAGREGLKVKCDFLTRETPSWRSDPSSTAQASPVPSAALVSQPEGTGVQPGAGLAAFPGSPGSPCPAHSGAAVGAGPVSSSSHKERSFLHKFLQLLAPSAPCPRQGFPGAVTTLMRARNWS